MRVIPFIRSLLLIFLENNIRVARSKVVEICYHNWSLSDRWVHLEKNGYCERWKLWHCGPSPIMHFQGSIPQISQVLTNWATNSISNGCSTAVHNVTKLLHNHTEGPWNNFILLNHWSQNKNSVFKSTGIKWQKVHIWRQIVYFRFS